jgi:TolB-like protein
MTMRYQLTVLAVIAGLSHSGVVTAQTAGSVAVLPLENAGSYGRDKEEFEALRRGLAATLAGELGAAGITVIDRDRVQRLVDTETTAEKIDLATAAKIGRGLGSRFVVVASFIDLYGDFRIDANLVDVQSGEVIKVVRSDPKLSDQRQMFHSVQSVAHRLAETIQPGTRAPANRTRNVPSEALGLFSRALFYADKGDRARAIDFLNRALKSYPGYSEAQAELKRIQGA